MTITQSSLLFLATFVAVSVFTPIVRIIAIKIDFVDIPNSSHKSHSKAIPYLGGVSIILVVLIVIYTAILTQSNMNDYFWIATSLFGPALLLGIVGLIDDRISLRPQPRFLAQSAAGLFTAIFILATNTVGNPTGNSILDSIITILWFVGISNAINFFDNLDGGASGTVAVASFGLFVITQWNGQYLISATSLTIFGATCGFLIWNKSPAKIYMGDAGALFLGTVLAALTVRLNPNSDQKIISFAIPLLLLAVPILDTAVAVVSRIRRGKSIFVGGQDHLSHRILRQGLSKRKTAYLLWSLAAIFTGIATTISLIDFGAILCVYFAAILWIALLIIFLRTKDE